MPVQVELLHRLIAERLGSMQILQHQLATSLHLVMLGIMSMLMDVSLAHLDLLALVEWLQQ